MEKLSDYGEETGYDLDDILSLLDMPTLFSSQYPKIIRILCAEIDILRDECQLRGELLVSEGLWDEDMIIND